MPKLPRSSWLPGVLAWAAIALAGCGGGDDGAASDKAAETSAATPERSAVEPGASRQFRLETTLRCKDARRTLRLPRTLPRASRLDRYVGRARQRDGALLNAISSVRPPDEQAAAQVQALQGAYATLLPLYDRVLVADDRRTLIQLRSEIGANERAVAKVAASMGVAACGPVDPAA